MSRVSLSSCSRGGYTSSTERIIAADWFLVMAAEVEDGDNEEGDSNDALHKAINKAPKVIDGHGLLDCVSKDADKEER